MSTLTISRRDTTELDYVFGWRDPAPGPWLDTGETISSTEVTASAGLTLGTGPKAPAISDGDVRAWLSPSSDLTPGQRLWVDCKIVTSAGRTETKRMELLVTD